MNLGQLVGELTMRAEAAEALGAPPVVADQPPREAPKPRGQRQHQVVELLADGRSVDVASLAASLGISAAHAGVLVHTMAAKGLISRHGTPHQYRYTRLGVPSTHPAA